jgi:uncharacterized protein YyaL (SSP411 family)
MPDESDSKKTNRLINEKSPYLLQHAFNPVDWYPWGSEAFEKAKKEDKPIFLSIGYSTCHWCHVMEHESFEDPEVAKLMNEVFVSIKVDREERPDIDNLYMTVAHVMGSRGGWPLTIIMTPDKKPFFAATYIPKKGRFGMTGMIHIIPYIQELWTNKRDEIVNTTDKVVSALKEVSKIPLGERLEEGMLNQAYKSLSNRFDEEYGGFSDAPKFPTPHNLLFLLRYWNRTGDTNALRMVEKTLQFMRLGGMYDHIGFGFHRYSTDFLWLVPHFEKMLYDQAMLAMAYIEAYQATQNKEYEKTAREIFTYVLRDMTAPTGGFYSAEDADSEGKEGKFYLWEEEEINQILDIQEADLIKKVYNIEERGNFIDMTIQRRTGENIPHLKKPLADIAKELNQSEEDLNNQIETIRKRLFEVREKRIHPHKDDKILTDWNGLMIAALAKGARVFEEPLYENAAKHAVDFIFKNMLNSGGRLLHRYRDGEATILAQVDDYAFLIWGLIELYEITFDANYLQTALDLNEELIKYFWDDEVGGFYLTPADGEELLVRQKVIYDGAIPSGNSIAMLNLLRLGRIAADEDFDEKASEIGKVFSRNVKESPAAHNQLMVALDFSIGPSYQVVIAGDSQAEDTKKMLNAIQKRFLPKMLVFLNPIEQESPKIHNIAEFIKYMPNIESKATAYVCINYTCKNPTTDVNEMLKQLGINQ